MSEKPTTEPSLIVLSWLAGLRSRGLEPYLAGTKITWLPKTAVITEGEHEVLKKHRAAIRDEIRRRSSVNDDGAPGGAGGAGDEDHRSASNAGGVNPIVSSDAASSPTILVVPPLDATGKTKAALAADLKLKESRPHIWRVIHGRDPEVIAELEKERTHEMLVALGVRSPYETY